MPSYLAPAPGLSRAAGFAHAPSLAFGSLARGKPCFPVGPLLAAVDAAHRRVLKGEPSGSPVPPPGRVTASRGLPPAAGHRDAERLLGDTRWELPDDPALEDDEDPVGERQDLVQLEGDEQHAAAFVALPDEAAVDELDRADVEAARRLCGDQDLRIAVDLPGEHHLLLVAA